MKPVALGVIGCGVIGGYHLGAAKESPLIDVLAVADLREDAARAQADEFKIQTVYGDANDLLADPRIEGVVLAMPTHPRTDLALRAFDKGKHVLTEKPVAMNAAEVRRMIRARGNLVAACCSSRHRFQPSARAAADFIAGGGLGELRVLFSRCIAGAGKPPRNTPPAWRLSKALNGGGILVNWGCYDLDYLLGLTGWSLKPVQVFAQCWTVPPQFESHVAPGSDAESHFVALIRCENGAVISIERAEYAAAQSENTWQITGARGSLHLQMLPAEGKKIVHDDSTTEQGVISRTIWKGDEEGLTANGGPILDFAAAIRESRPPMTSLENALIVQQITDAIYQSAEQGAAVVIE